MGDLAVLYDIENCPRDDGGRLRSQGKIADYPGDTPQPFFSCSVCGKWWTVIELRRKARASSWLDKAVSSDG